MKKQKNPPGAVLIYQATPGVVIQGMRKKPGGPMYRHKFKKPIQIIGLSNGDVLLTSRKPKR